MTDLVSVIIPVYKVEDYIHKCVDSVVNQSYKNLEIILVDDGSPDNCPKICDEYAKKDKRIKVIHKKNGGLSDARNAGIDKCHGKYITFVDSDDWLPLDAIEWLHSIAEKTNSDIASGNLKEVFDRDERKDLADDNHYDVLGREDALEALMYLHDLSNSASGKIYKKELFDNIKYPVGKHYEDLATTYKIFDEANNVVVSKRIVYYYYQCNSGSIRHNSYSEKRLEAVKFAEEELKFIEKKYPAIKNAAVYRLFFECLSALNDMPARCKDKDSIKKKIRNYRKIVTRDKKISKKQKLLCRSSYFGRLGIKFAFAFKKAIKK